MNKKNKLYAQVVALGIMVIFGFSALPLTPKSASAFQSWADASCNTATLNGHIEPNGAPTDVWFEYSNGNGSSLGNSSPRQTFTSSSDFNYRINNLTPNTTYYFRAMAHNRNGDDVGDTLNFFTTCNNQPTNPTFVNFDFIVKNSCDNSAIPNATVTIDQDFGNGTSRTTDGSGFADLGVHSNTNLRWTASKSGFSSDSGNKNSGSSNGTVYPILTPNGGCNQPPPPPQNVSAKGYLDSASCSEITGWAFGQNYSTATVELSDGRNTVSVLANTNRQDVGIAYPAAGAWHGFSTPTPSVFKDFSSHTIFATVGGVALGTSPKTIPACQSTPPPSPQMCQDPSALNFGGSLPCRYPPPTPQTCQDSSAINFGGALPCRYPAQTCQDPTATNYRGSLPCTYPPQTCTDPNATNYRTGFPCTYPTPTCQDPSALNYRGTLPCQYPQQLCQDPAANNYRGTLPCTYPGPTCQDPNALNYRGTLPCTYPAQTCQDPNANNYRSVGTCTYTQRCQDTTATNYGSVGSCIYNNIQRCQDTRAINYGATGSCIYNQPIQTCQDPNAINYRGYLPCNYRPTILSTPRPTVVIFSDQTSIPFNGTGTIRWITTNATSCFASGGSVGWPGAKSIGPGSFYTGSLVASRTYTITCNNSFGSATDSVTLNVRGQVITTNTVRPAPSSYVVISSSIDRNQPIVPTLDNTRPHPGDEINYTVTYQNIGNASITNLTLRLDLPYEVNYLSSNPNNPTITGNTLIFNLGTLRANGQGTVTARVRVRENIPFGTPLNFPAVLSYTDPSGNPQTVTANVSAQVWSEPIPINENLDASLGASVFGSGIFFPNSLLGWLLLLILILVLILLAKYFYDQTSRPERPIEH